MTEREIVLAYLHAFVEGDPDVIASFVTDDFENVHTGALAQGSTGKAAYRRRLPAFLADFAGVAYEVEEVVAEGTSVAVAYVMRCRYRDTPVRLQGIFRFLLRDGRIARRVDYWDGVSFLDQVGPAAQSAARPEAG